MVTLFFCPKESADTGQWRIWYKPQIRRASSARFCLSSFHTSHQESQFHLVHDHWPGNHLTGCLHHQSDLLPSFLHGQRGHVRAAKQDSSAIRFAESHNQGGKCGFSRTVSSYKRNHLPFADLKRYIL